VFPSRIKPGAVHAPLTLLRDARQFDLPVCAIGGIDAANLRKVVAAGADMAAVISAVFAADDIGKAAREMSGAFERGVRS
jgi:thiamine-phosphate pyrophosphorylase